MTVKIRDKNINYWKSQRNLSIIIILIQENFSELNTFTIEMPESNKVNKKLSKLRYNEEILTFLSGSRGEGTNLCRQIQYHCSYKSQ